MGFVKRPLHPNMTHQQLVKAVNDNFTDIENLYKTTIYKDNTGTPRILIGYQRNGF